MRGASEKLVLFGQAAKGTSFECVVLGIFDSRLNLPLVPWHAGFCGQYDRLIMLGKGSDLGVELGIKPIGLGDRRPHIIDHTSVGNFHQGTGTHSPGSG
jgi:hypothetical protein